MCWRMTWSESRSRRAGEAEAADGNSSGHATRALLLADPPSVDGGEITDKATSISAPC